jgi:hypothetical protein
MYYELFACTVYNFYGLGLYTMFDSHDVYLCVLYTICMYKFSRCHIVVFTIFLFHLPIFDKKMAGFRQKPAGNRHAGFLKNQLIYRCSLFSLFLRRLRCVLTKFSCFSLIFIKFFKN